MVFGLVGSVIGIILLILGVFLVFFFPQPTLHQGETMGIVGVILGFIFIIIGGILVFL